MEWLRDRSCIACALSPGMQEGSSVACHTENNGMRSKGPDSGCVPMCDYHHSLYDGRQRFPDGSTGKKVFEAYYGLNMANEAAAHWAVFQIDQENRR